MKKVLVLLADGSEEIETTSIVNILRRAGIDVTLAGIANRQVTGSRGIVMVADGLLSVYENDLENYDAVVLPGGWEGTLAFCANANVLAIARAFCEAGKLVAAICAAPLALDKAGLLTGLKFTCYPGLQEQIVAKAGYLDEAVTEDGNFITARGPAVAMQFALKLVERLIDKTTAQKVADELLYS